LNEYLLLKEEQKKKGTFIQSFGRDPVIKSTMSKLVTLLDDFSTYRKTVSDNNPNTDFVYQDIEIPTSKPSNPSEKLAKIKEQPQPKNTNSFTSNVTLQDLGLSNNSTNFTTQSAPTKVSKQATDLFPSPRRKPVTPKKLKPSTESTVTPAKKNLSFDAYTPGNVSSSSLSTSISPKLDEESIVRALMADIQFQEKLAEQINTHLPSDTIDLPQEFFFQQHQPQQQQIANTAIGLSTNAVQEIINNLTSESVLETYFNSCKYFY
jgi:hypothetical protein